MKKKFFLTAVGLIALLIAGFSIAPGHRPIKAEVPAEKLVQEPWIPMGDNGVYLVANTDYVASILNVAGAEIHVTGRASFHLSGSESQIKEGVVQVNGFSLAYFGVPQQILAGEIETTTKSGVLGFAADTSEPQRLRYDTETGTISGEIRGYIDAAYMSALIIEPVMDDRGDLFKAVSQPAKLALDLKITAPLKGEIDEVAHDQAQLSFKLNADSVEFDSYELASFDLSVAEELPTNVDIASWWLFTVAKSLCIQPIRIFRVSVSPVFMGGPLIGVAETTGDGLAFGQPGAIHIWRKADVTFDFRRWKTLLEPAYWVVTGSTGDVFSSEVSDLLVEVDDDDCIEVYFIHEFDPVSWEGGGVTYGEGEASAKIITSDANAAGGVDFNHLAHELGHVMGLLHPNQSVTANAVPASTGTVMCTGGFLNDNPGVNSQENKNNLSNPLFEYYLTVLPLGVPDCQDSADCGRCP